MPPSNSVLRRYTPPTCTLQIIAPKSPVSPEVRRSKPTSTPLEFELSFDDPRLPEEQRINIKGDRDKLEALHEAVTIGVQDLLNRSDERFNAVFEVTKPPSSDAVIPSSLQSVDLSANDHVLSQDSQTLDTSKPSPHLDLDVVPKQAIATSARAIFLQLDEGLTHKLFLGPLATKESGPAIHLSVLQLFDLATALDEYAVDVVNLPTQSRPRFAGAPPAWASIAAILVVGVGLTAVMVQLGTRTPQQQTANKTPNPGLSSNDQQPIALQPSPTPTLGGLTPPLTSPALQPSPTPTLGGLTPPLTSPDNLPSPPPLGSIVPSPSPSNPSVILPNGRLPAIPLAPRANIPQTTPFIVGVTPPITPQKRLPAIPFRRITPPSPVLINPVPKQDGSLSIPGAATAPQKNDAQIPNLSIVPPSAPIPSPSLDNPGLDLPSQTNPGVAPTEEPSNTPTTPTENATLPEIQATPTQSPRTPTTSEQARATGLTSNTQVGEVRDYFKQQWEPPPGLTQTLEYSLLLDVDGTIQRIEPLGQAARKYVDRTGMPLIGERFVSPNKSGQSPRIRLVLSPDGKVQAFLESTN